MRLVVLIALAAAACEVRDSDPLPPEPECLDPVTRPGEPCTVDITAEVMQFETQAVPSVPVALRYDTAWDVPQVFAVQCTPLATGNASLGTGYVATFEDVSCVSPGAHVVSLIGDDASGAPDLLAPSLNDRKLATSCWTGGACSLAPFRVWVLEKSTFDGWKQQIRGVDWTTHGLVAVTYRNANGTPVEGVTPRLRDLFETSPRTAIPGGEVFFLAGDRRTIDPSRSTTAASGTAIFLVVAGLQEHVSGGHPTLRWPETGVAAAGNTVFFEQLDP
jgi:hypothetical protein